jgi:hypothetical protein
MIIMDQTGHTRLHWDADDEDDVANARKMFSELTSKGYAAFERGRGGAQGERVSEFDPEAGTLIMVPQLKGG